MCVSACTHTYTYGHMFLALEQLWFKYPILKPISPPEFKYLQVVFIWQLSDKDSVLFESCLINVGKFQSLHVGLNAALLC